MFDYMLTDAQLGLRDEVRDLVKWVPRKMILDMDEDTCKAQREVYGDVVDRYDGLIYWLDEFEYTGCTEDGGSPVALSPAFEEGMDIPPHTRKWGYTPPTFKKRDSIW